MKKNYLAFIKYTFVCILFLVSCQKETKQLTINKVKEKKKNKKDPNNHKKGIEHIADYQEQIRKGLYEEKSNYKEGNLMIEYNKAKKAVLSKRKASSISPVFVERGPFNVPGRARGIAVDPTDATKWFVGSVGGGVWLTTDSGSTWNQLTDFKIPNLATSTIVISQNDANTIYVGTGEPFGNLDAIGGSGVFKSIDGGTNWTHLTATTTFGSVGRIIINPTDKNNLLVATTTGVYRTTDGGMNWAQTYVSSGRVQDLDADPTNFNIQYASVNGFGIVKSTDGGLNWATSFDKANYNNNHSRFETAVSLADPNTLFLSVYSGSGATIGVNTDFYVSRDKGVTYTNLTTNDTNANLLTGQGWYDNALMAHPYDANVFYVGGVAVFKVTVAGSTFTATPNASGYDSSQINSEVHVDQHGLFSILGTNQEFKILLANDGGVYSTTMKQDPGATDGDWSSAVSGKNSTQFYGASKQNGEEYYLAGAQDNGSWLTYNNDGTNTPTSSTSNYTGVLGGDGFENIWHYNNPYDFIVTSQYNFIARYIGFSPELSPFPDRDNAPFFSKIANVNNNPDVVFTITSQGVWRSPDFAASWNLTAIPSNFNPAAPGAPSALNVKVSPADPNVVWAGAAMTESGSYTLHVSQDNGLTFTNAGAYDNPNGSHNFYISGMGTSYINRNSAYALFSGQGSPKILKTEDLGVTWTDITGFSTGSPNTTGFPDVAVHSILEMPFDEDLIWAGTDIGVFETENGGTSWALVTGLPAVSVYDMKVVNDQVVIATHGRGVWSATISELNNYTPAEYLGVAQATTKQKTIDGFKTVVSYQVPTDDVSKVKIFIDDVEKAEITQDFDAATVYTYETADLAEGYYKLGIQVFEDANNSQSIINSQEFFVIDFKDVSTSISISQFEATDVFVYKSDFTIDNLDGEVSGLVLNNTSHPYSNGKEYTTYLKTPLTISSTNKTISYEDMAIVEPYTDDLEDLTSFYDYVTIEASTDLVTWKTIDKYDARRFPEWLTEFNKGAAASASDALFKAQSVTLNEEDFPAGETIVLRFRFVADGGTNSYGWAIKSINSSTASLDDVLAGKKEFTLYPTVSNGNFTLQAKNTLGKAKMNIVDISGKQVYNRKVDFTTNDKHEISVNLQSGVYIVSLIDENNKKSSNKIVIK